jgi:hypothetical protein
MPVESVPTRRPARDPDAALWSGEPVARLDRVDFAPRDVVEPLLRSARSAVASLTLKARTAEQEARAAEESAWSGDDLDPDVVAARNAAQLAVVEEEIEAARRRRDAAVEGARRDAEVLIGAAREEGRALVAAAREAHDRSLAALSGAPPLATPETPRATAVAASTPPEPEPAPPVGTPPGFPPPAAGPTYPPPSPAPTLPPPMVAAPLAPPLAPSFASVLLQAPDGTFHQALVLTTGPTQAPMAPMAPAAPVAQPAPMAPSAVAPPALMPAPTPIPAPVPVAEAAAVPAAAVAPTKAPGRRLLHLDVILPLIAVLLVLVVLLAWLG